LGEDTRGGGVNGEGEERRRRVLESGIRGKQLLLDALRV
jgi:hypothetical protein